jgi:hypothetical protein
MAARLAIFLYKKPIPKMSLPRHSLQGDSGSPHFLTT